MPVEERQLEAGRLVLTVVVRVAIQRHSAGLLVRAGLDHERAAAGGLRLEVDGLLERLARRDAAAQRAPDRAQRVRVRALGLQREGVAVCERRIDPRLGELAGDRALVAHVRVRSTSAASSASISRSGMPMLFGAILTPGRILKMWSTRPAARTTAPGRRRRTWDRRSTG